VPGDLVSNAAGNYAYDATGNLTQDTSEHIGANGIVWTPMNKIKSITKTSSTQKIEYLYDAMGNRVRKMVYEPTSTLKSTTWYLRDPNGTVMSTYTKTGSDTLRLSEVPIYGSERIGMITPNVAYKSANIDTMDATFTRTLGKRMYELKDHLGNVRATVSDILIDHSGSKDAELVASTDYYPFGMEMPGRTYKATGSAAYRYGFNGKENDNEVKGEGNQQDYGFRIYDPRVARFLSVDPLTKEFSWLSPFQFASNRAIEAIDLDGLEGIRPNPSGSRPARRGNQPSNYGTSPRSSGSAPRMLIDRTIYLPQPLPEGEINGLSMRVGRGDDGSPVSMQTSTRTDGLQIVLELTTTTGQMYTESINLSPTKIIQTTVDGAGHLSEQSTKLYLGGKDGLKLIELQRVWEQKVDDFVNQRTSFMAPTEKSLAAGLLLSTIELQPTIGPSPVNQAKAELSKQIQAGKVIEVQLPREAKTMIGPIVETGVE